MEIRNALTSCIVIGGSYLGQRHDCEGKVYVLDILCSVKLLERVAVCVIRRLKVFRRPRILGAVVGEILHRRNHRSHAVVVKVLALV